jgi:hypothetical protein
MWAAWSSGKRMPFKWWGGYYSNGGGSDRYGAAMVIVTLIVLAMAFMCHTPFEIPPFLSIWLVEVSPSNLNDQNGKSMYTLLQG